MINSYNECLLDVLPVMCCLHVDVFSVYVLLMLVWLLHLYCIC